MDDKLISKKTIRVSTMEKPIFHIEDEDDFGKVSVYCIPESLYKAERAPLISVLGIRHQTTRR